jgi:hypothetical protein
MIDRTPRPKGPEDLCDRLTAMRAELLVDLATKRHSPAFLALFANVTTVIEAVERVSVKPEPATLQTAARAVVSGDGAAIRMMLYDDTGTVATVEFGPVRAIGLASRLIEAAIPRLSR